MTLGEAEMSLRPDVAVADPESLLAQPGSVWRIAGRRFLQRKVGIVGLCLVSFMILVAIFAPLIAPYDPYQNFIGQEGEERWEAPCINAFGCEGTQHIFGLDGNVRDFFSRVVYAARVSLPLGFTTVLLIIIIGTVIGAVSGYVGGWSDNVMMRIMDVVLGFPSLILAIAIVFVLGPGLRNALLAITIVTIPQYARVMRASVLSIKEVDYVSASRALGASPWKVLVTRVLPNALTPLVVLATLGVATVILEAAALGFLGLGAVPPTPEWGSMLAEERDRIFTAPHLMIFPGLAIMITVLGFNLMGDGLRDALDPTLNK